MSRLLRLLAVEHSADDLERLVADLRAAGYEPHWHRVDTAETMAAALDQSTWDLVIADYRLPRFGALAALALLASRNLDIPFLIVSGTIEDEAAAVAMRAGARDCLTKGHTARLLPVIDRELREADDHRHRKLAEQALARQASHDQLTGLVNRSHFQRRLHQLVHTSHHGSLAIAILLVDLDRFRDVNHVGGYEAGDDVLRQYADRLRAEAPEAEIVARLGGDEFAVVLSGTELSLAEQTADRLCAMLEAPFGSAGRPYSLASSIGIAQFPAHGDDAETLLQQAELAMYAAKRAGGGWAVYDAEQAGESPGRLDLLDELHRATRLRELELHYQPKLHMRDGALAGVEALIRWNHPRRGRLSAKRFIPYAEQTSLMPLLTRWVIDESLQQAHAWRKHGRDIQVAVNLSARSLDDADLPQTIGYLLEVWDARPDWLSIELTESALMADPIRAADVLRRLHEMGIRLSIDDFGTGYSSLAHLRQLPVDEIKIDRTFVQDITRHEQDHAIVRSTIDLGHNLGIGVVAEGIENQATWTALDRLGCDVAQGYFLSRPVAAAHLIAWLDTRGPERGSSPARN